MQVNGINGPGNVSNVQRVQTPQSGAGEKGLEASREHSQVQDKLDISQDISTRPADAPGADGIRHELVNRVRAEIMAGTYDTDEKMEIALGRLLDELEGR